ncbi:juvenile hormone acid O-methyltransferase-like [Musca autumnalis]|uniref:juvenile hormone acid O-methyltransferase-like n=1 Tax=Musca autumnalis TaxID=221902 RepID=UPI003CFA7FCF
MNHPDWYHKANDAQRFDSRENFHKYIKQIQWRYDGEDSTIDIGCGSGDVLMDIVYPCLPKNFQTLVCSDINPKMLNYARRQYGHMEKVQFQVLDIGTKKKLPNNLRHQFDHVISFYTLMWVQDQRQALENIFNLLRPKCGDCLLVFLASHPLYEAYRMTSGNSKWSEYMYDIDSIISPFQYVDQPAEKYVDLMSQVGFTKSEVRLLQKQFTYESFDVFRANMKAVNPFIHRIPMALHEEFMDEVMFMYLKHMGLHEEEMDFKAKCSVSYGLLVAFGRKAKFSARERFRRNLLEICELRNLEKYSKIF